MSNRSIGKSLFEDAMSAKEDVVSGLSPVTFEVRPFMIVSALLSAIAAYFTPDPTMKTGLIMIALIGNGMSLSLRWGSAARLTKAEEG